MPKKTFALEEGGRPRVELEWGAFMKNLCVRVDGQELGVIPRRKELEAGRSYTLPDGSALGVQLARSALSAELRVTRNGVPLPGSATDPAERVKQASYVFYIVAAVSILAGLLTELGGVDSLRAIGVGWATAVEGALFAFLGWRTAKRSWIALSAGMVLFAVDTILSLTTSVQAGATPPVAGLVTRALFFIVLVKGFQGARALRAAGQTAPSGART